jgi:uncharacterized protein (TIGR02217 family)
MTAFLESPRFPDEIAYWAIGGRAFQTIVVQTYGGDEYRNAAWQYALGEWDFQDAWRVADANSAWASLAQKLLRNFFAVLYGQLGAFRFKDFSDYTDEGHGVFTAIDATHFQMFKAYTSGSATYNHPVYKPVTGTVTVTGGSSPSVDYTTGVVTVSSGTPTSWVGQFDKPVRFGSDLPKMGPDSSGALYNWQGIKLVEVRNLSA